MTAPLTGATVEPIIEPMPEPLSGPLDAPTAGPVDGRADERVDGRVREAVAAVRDPELRVLTIEELGVLREVLVEDGRVVVTVTPTYLGCPAMEVIKSDIVSAARAAGGRDVEVLVTYSPPWTTDWIGEEARAKLGAAGVAPPGGGPVPLTLSVRCPHCGSPDTAQIARYGATLCRALWRCTRCRQPFEHLRDH
ncbi:1,2-phenylacetyl-CoA epoxidase subunit PaaD [Nonomuraea sp. MG754425]|uniref:1,2-phenylacetyl-CoA epoxidase subunit PaaD n=1 Tax=Nonomuraea sp. MG754425 TaxID=2570319 RepID=UPI001F007331|nr:1,2-phenylacetyl-CoA epoxidase subunit PaaD [Nonomuraea sp. MG754425]